MLYTVCMGVVYWVGVNREKFSFEMDRRTEAQVKVLSCAFAAKSYLDQDLSLSLTD